jgi:hypothetical protein
MMLPDFILMPVYAFADGFAGGSLGKKLKAIDAKLPGRAAFWAALLGAGVGYLTSGAPGALAGIAWLIWRTPDWDIFGGDTTAQGAKEIAGTVARHLIPLPLLLVIGYWTGLDLSKVAGALLVFALAATVLSIEYGKKETAATEAGVSVDPKFNTFVELARGALFGAALWAVLP